MFARSIAACAVAIACAGNAVASNWAFSLFESDLRRRSNVESAGTVTTWQGSFGAAAERQLGHGVFAGVSLERRRDVFSERLGGRLCGPNRNTCFDTHRIEIVSKPVTLFVGGAREWKRATIFTTAGVRYVRPSVHDLSPPTTIPGVSFGASVWRRTSVEARAGAALRVAGRLGVFAERCRLFRSPTDWDPRWRTNAGLRFHW